MVSKIILDLDNTIISSLTPEQVQPDGFRGYDMEGTYFTYERPGLQEFLDFLFENYEVAVWTAASKSYAIFIVKHIILQNKPNRKLKFLLYNYHGDLSSQFSQCPKDLKLIFKTFLEFTSENTIIIDDCNEVVAAQQQNSYHIPPFQADDPAALKDRELEKLRKKLYK